MESDRAGGGAGPAGQSHLAWCCDAEECLSPVAESQSSLGGTTMNVAAGDGVPWDQMLLLDSAQPSSTSASVSDADCLQCASIPMIDTCCAPSAIHAGCIDPTCVPPAALARADCPTCVDGLGLITIDGDGGHVATLEEKGKGVARRKDGDEQIPDLDSLLQGLDEQTIQDIVGFALFLASRSLTLVYRSSIAAAATPSCTTSRRLSTRPPTSSTSNFRSTSTAPSRTSFLLHILIPIRLTCTPLPQHSTPPQSSTDSRARLFSHQLLRPFLRQRLLRPRQRPSPPLLRRSTAAGETAPSRSSRTTS